MQNDSGASSEAERVRKLRERVEAQEAKLRKLRALRGQVDQQRITNGSLGNLFIHHLNLSPFDSTICLLL